ncbi:MAG: TIGR03960 family B12-binding radical SAM protein [Candidatus Aminicenantes bacterium]|nr:TIGR03960 family B12-binding radical SAM protein [Candidatus Aminicenantes bacterium]
MDGILPAVEKPGRYTGGEWNEVRKDPARAKVKVALAFPDVYEIGMSYLGQKILYALINALPSALAERVFAPWPDFERELRERGSPLRSLENKIPLAEFDIIGFSLLYELNYSNILTILDLGGIPLRADERDLRHPLVIAGGPAAFNPEPVADFFDLFLLGDGEEAVPEIIGKYEDMKGGAASRKDILMELARIPGVYVPSFYEAFCPDGGSLLTVRPRAGAPALIRKRVLRDFSRSFFPADIIVPNIRAVFDRVAVEVARGCPHKCRFCQATSLYAPYRIKDPSYVVDRLFESLRATGYEDASLFSLSVSDYPYLGETIRTLMNSLEKDHVSLSLSSLRPQGLSAEIIRDIIKVRKTGFTLVPEAGSERLRSVINKDLKDQDIWDAAANAFREGWKLLKLYFMIGLPTEREEDLRGIAALIDDLTALGREIMTSPPRINMSVSSFIPKPHTPFQWAAMDGEEALREKQVYLKRLLKKKRHVQIKDHPVENSLLEAVFSRGDRRLSAVLRAAWNRGARFDSWGDHFQLPLWLRAFDETGVDPQTYLGALERSAALPWDHIETGVHKSFLLAELEKALKAERSPSCLETSCGLCRGCDFMADIDREFKAKIEVGDRPGPDLGRRTETVFRYQAFYGKRGQARFVSHNDLLNILQRTFKRAGVNALFTKGFHPKMQMSLAPALPLGMTGNDESFEFKSTDDLDEQSFMAALDRCAPDGILFSGLKKIAPAERSLTERISSMVYSLDLGAAEAREGLAVRKGEGDPEGVTEKIAARLIDEYRPAKPDLLQEIFVDEPGRKIVLKIAYSPQRSLRPQDVVERALGLQRAVYLMTREKIYFK